MNKKIATICSVIILISGLHVLGQNKEHAYLKIGDKVPDFIFPIKNYKTNKAKISDFKGKLVILDLWATYCSSCIAAMPHMNDLQKKFDGKIQVIMVTTDDDKKIALHAAHSDNIRTNKLPSATNAKKLAGLFHYISLPTHVWIDQNGIVKFITSGLGANEKNIQDYLDGKELALEEKKDLKVAGDMPYLAFWYPYHKEISIYTYLSPSQKEYHANMGSGFSRNEDGSIHEIHTGYSSLKNLYKLAYGMPSTTGQFSDSRVLTNFKDAQKYAFIPHADYRVAGLSYMFQLINNNNLPDERIYKFIQNQFDLAFNIKSTWEKKVVSCYVLRRQPGDDKMLSKGGPFKGEYQGPVYSVQNLTWETVFGNLNFAAPFQLIDESGINPDERIDIKIDTRLDSLDYVNESIKSYGLFFTKEERELDCIVLTDPE